MWGGSKNRVLPAAADFMRISTTPLRANKVTKIIIPHILLKNLQKLCFQLQCHCTLRKYPNKYCFLKWPILHVVHNIIGWVLIKRAINTQNKLLPATTLWALIKTTFEFWGSQHWIFGDPRNRIIMESFIIMEATAFFKMTKFVHMSKGIAEMPRQLRKAQFFTDTVPFPKIWVLPKRKHFLQMSRQLRKIQAFPEMPDFRKCLRHV